jgi:hypothetical protein
LEKLRQNRRGVALGTGQMTKFLLQCMSPLLAQSGHERLNFAAVQLTLEPHFVHRKSLM